MSEVKSTPEATIGVEEIRSKLCFLFTSLLHSKSRVAEFAMNSFKIQEDCIQRGQFEILKYFAITNLKRIGILQHIIKLSFENNVNINDYVEETNQKWQLIEPNIKNEFTINVHKITNSLLDKLATSSTKHMKLIEEFDINLPPEFNAGILTQTLNSDQSMSPFLDNAKQLSIKLPSQIEKLTKDFEKIASDFIDVLANCVINAVDRAEKESNEFLSKDVLEIGKKFNDPVGVTKSLQNYLK